MTKDKCIYKVSITCTVLFAIMAGVSLADECLNLRRKCDRSTFGCNYRSYYADIYTNTVCRGCNVCIKPGSPLDSKGCPQLPCPDMREFDTDTCYKPEVYNSWVVYRGWKCETCEAMYCEMGFKQT